MRESLDFRQTRMSEAANGLNLLVLRQRPVNIETVKKPCNGSSEWVARIAIGK